VSDAEFDEYRETYRDEVQQSIDFIGQDHAFFVQVKTRYLIDLARRELGDPKTLRVLDVGCGTGETDAFLAGEFAALEGVDVSEGVVEKARERNPGVTYRAYDGEQLPYEDGSFDLAFTICVIHHVPPAQWRSFAQELARIVRPGGLLVVIEHNPFNPLTRLAVSRCEFDENAELLPRRRTRGLLRRAGLELRDSRYIIFFPWANPVLTRVESALRRVPLGAQYAVAGRRRA
jgi:SAM-dependent methyltransferase